MSLKANGMSTLEIDVGDIRPVSVVFTANELVVTLADGRSVGGVAWWAHIGGFIVGLILIPFIQRSQQKYRAYYADEGILGFDTQGRG